jgi:hypothetical protein
VAAQPAATAYAPVAAYQTVQAPVPVTYYRPNTVLSPTTGAAVSTMTGCTLVQVQTQRRPAWWDPLGLFTPRAAAVSPYPINVQYPTTAGYAPAATVTSPAYAAPAYAAPGYAAPAATYGAPAGGNCPGCSGGAQTFPAVPSAPVNPGGSILGNPPAATYGAPSGPGGAAATPADQPPSLNSPPQGSYQGSSYSPAPAQPMTPSLAPPAAPELDGAKPAGETSPPQGEARDLRLIPYPGDASQPAESAAPPLLNQRGKTASFRRVAPWSYSTISWPERNELQAVRTATADVHPGSLASSPAAPAPAPTANHLDDGGWRPARGR